MITPTSARDRGLRRLAVATRAVAAAAVAGSGVVALVAARSATAAHTPRVGAAATAGAVDPGSATAVPDPTGNESDDSSQAVTPAASAPQRSVRTVRPVRTTAAPVVSSGAS